MEEVICTIQGVSKLYRVRKGFFSTRTTLIKALDRVSLKIRRQEILGLVGESGCGKSTLARLVLGLEKPSNGKINFEGIDLSAIEGKKLKAFRKRAQMVFQDPFSSLNPKKTIFQIISQPLKIHGICPKEQLRSEVRRLLKMAGLDSPGLEDRYPHEFSGGQRQRIGIARALATRPDLVIMDEPTSALDVSIQAQIINLILDLHESRKITCLFISHDLPIVEFVSHRIAVMYKGSIVEIMPKEAFGLTRKNTQNIPHHPYTAFLMDSVPIPEPEIFSSCETGRKETELEDKADVIQPETSSGCPFAPRCHKRMTKCLTEKPGPIEISPEHTIFCHLFTPGKKELRTNEV